MNVRKYTKRRDSIIKVPDVPKELIEQATKAGNRESIIQQAQDLGKPVAFAGVMHEGKYIVGLAEKNVYGYTPVPELGNFSGYDEASAYADEMNEDLGISRKDAIEIAVSAMRPRKGR